MAEHSKRDKILQYEHEVTTIEQELGPVDPKNGEKESESYLKMLRPNGPDYYSPAYNTPLPTSNCLCVVCNRMFETPDAVLAHWEDSPKCNADKWFCGLCIEEGIKDHKQCKHFSGPPRVILLDNAPPGMQQASLGGEYQPNVINMMLYRSNQPPTTTSTPAAVAVTTRQPPPPTQPVVAVAVAHHPAAGQPPHSIPEGAPAVPHLPLHEPHLHPPHVHHHHHSPSADHHIRVVGANQRAVAYNRRHVSEDTKICPMPPPPNTDPMKPTPYRIDFLLNSGIVKHAKMSTGKHVHSRLYFEKKRPRKPRTHFTDSQVEDLEKVFEDKKYLSVNERQTIAQDLNLHEEQVKNWFQNRRSKWRKDRKEGEEEGTEQGAVLAPKPGEVPSLRSGHTDTPIELHS